MHPLIRAMVIGAALVLLQISELRAQYDVQFLDLGGLQEVGRRTWKGPEAANARNSHYGGDPIDNPGAGDPVVGFTLFTMAKNVGDRPIPWYFSVFETKTGEPGGGVPATPWVEGVGAVSGNGYQGGHGYHADVPGTPAANRVGPHPHIRFFIYRQPAGGGLTVKIGQSDLKHAYQTGDANHHELAVNSVDTYGISHNRDQSFFGPVSEMDPVTFVVAAHDHMGSNMAGRPATEYYRDHGKPAFDLPGADPADDAGHPGADNIDHLLVAPLSLMTPPATGPQPRWFLVGTYYQTNDINTTNNTRWEEIFPTVGAGGTLTFPVPGGGALAGEGLETIPGIPEPNALALAGLALLLLFFVQRRPRASSCRQPIGELGGREKRGRTPPRITLG